MTQGKEITNQNQNTGIEIMEKVLMQGDLSKLSPDERLKYYSKVCESIGVNPFTRPFDYIQLNGKLTLYAKKECSDQLRQINGISITGLKRERTDDLYIVQASGVDKVGRADESIAAIYVGNLKGNDLANALMKCETKAKRRLTLSLAGLGWLDETELETIPQDKIVYGNYEIDGTESEAADTGKTTAPAADTQTASTPAKESQSGQQPQSEQGNNAPEKSKRISSKKAGQHTKAAQETSQETSKEIKITSEQQVIDTAQAEAEQKGKAAATATNETPSSEPNEQGNQVKIDIMFVQRKEKNDGTPYLKIAAKGQQDIIYINDVDAIEAIMSMSSQLPKNTISVTGRLVTINGVLLLESPKVQKAA